MNVQLRLAEWPPAGVAPCRTAHAATQVAEVSPA